MSPTTASPSCSSAHAPARPPTAERSTSPSLGACTGTCGSAALTTPKTSRARCSFASSTTSTISEATSAVLRPGSSRSRGTGARSTNAAATHAGRHLRAQLSPCPEMISAEHTGSRRTGERRAGRPLDAPRSPHTRSTRCPRVADRRRPPDSRSRTVLHKSPGNVKALQHRGVAALRRQLEGNSR